MLERTLFAAHSFNLDVAKATFNGCSFCNEVFAFDKFCAVLEIESPYRCEVFRPVLPAFCFSADVLGLDYVGCKSSVVDVEFDD